MTDMLTHEPQAPWVLSRQSVSPERSALPLPAPELEAFAGDFVAMVDTSAITRATNGCSVPGSDEEESVRHLLDSLAP